MRAIFERAAHSMWLAGHTGREIAAEIGCSTRYAYDIATVLKRAGWGFECSRARQLAPGPSPGAFSCSSVLATMVP